MNIKEPIIGCILAGGESRRFNGASKGLQKLSDKTLIEYVIQTFEPQVSKLYINTQDTAYKQYKLPMIKDKSDKPLGPLSGLISSLEYCKQNYSQANWLAIAPCDAPFLLPDMVEQLYRQKGDGKIALFSYKQYNQSTFSIWHTDTLEELNSITEKHGMMGFKQFLELTKQSVSIIDYTKQDINPFFNINSPADLLEAETIIKKAPGI